MIFAPVSLANSRVESPIGPAPIDQAGFVCLEARPVHRVATDRKRLDERQLLEPQLARDMQLARGDNEPRAQAAVAMHAERLVLLTAIRMASPTRVALLAVDVRFDRTAVAGRHVCYTVAHFEHLNSQLMPWNARIAEKRHLAQITAEVRTTNADLMNPYQGLARLGFVWPCDVNTFPLLGCVERKRFHWLQSLHLSTDRPHQKDQQPELHVPTRLAIAYPILDGTGSLFSARPSI